MFFGLGCYQNLLFRCILISIFRKLHVDFKHTIKFNVVYIYVLAARQQVDDICVKLNVECSAPRTTARLLDKVRSVSILDEF